MTILDLFTGLRAWMDDMPNTLARVNALYPEATAQIEFPRAKDLYVSFPGGLVNQIEQRPAIVIEWDTTTQPTQQSAGNLIGTLSLGLFILDEAKTEEERDQKLMKWVEMLLRHHSSPKAFLNSYSRISVSSIQPLVGSATTEATDSSGSSGNVLEVHAELLVPLAA